MTQREAASHVQRTAVCRKADEADEADEAAGVFAGSRLRLVGGALALDWTGDEIKLWAKSVSARKSPRATADLCLYLF